MIIIITGSSHTGKTLFAQRILEKYRIPYLSIDHLKMGLIKSGNTDLTAEDDDALTEYLWPIIREIIKTAIKNRQNLTVEGCYVPFDWRRDFDERYLPEIRFICLSFTNDYIVAHHADIFCACASILHVQTIELPDVFRRMITALKPGGIIYTSFKYGTFEGEQNGRWFSDFTEETLAEFLCQFPELSINDQWISADVRPGRSDEMWLNAILRKIHRNH